MIRVAPALVAFTWLVIASHPPSVAQTAASPAATGITDPAVPPALTLEAAIELALKTNPDLAAVRREVDAANALRQQAALRLNPTISYGLEDVGGGLRTSSLTFTQPFELGGKRAARIRAADEATTVAQAGVWLRAAELRAAVIQFYFDVLAAQQRADLAQRAVDLARRAVDVASRRVEAGRVSPLEETRARVAQAATQVESSQARTELDTARQRLAALFGETSPRSLVVGADTVQMTLPAEPSDFARRLEDAPELRLARAEVERLDAVTALARTQRVPDVAINAGNVSIAEAGTRATVVGVTVIVPLFNRNEGTIREAAVRAEQARQRLAAAQTRLRSEAIQAQQRLASARSQASTVRDQVLPGATSALEAATLGYELGRFGFLDVLDAQRTLFAAQSQLVRAVEDAYRAAADLERLAGPGTVDRSVLPPR